MVWVLNTTAVITLAGIVVAFALVSASKKFRVEKDERETAVRDCLPGNNCGACGYAGCDAAAEAIVRGEASVNICLVGGDACASRIGGIMGIAPQEEEKKVAFVHCKGTCEFTSNQGNYIGIQDCRNAVMSGLNVTDCAHGCLGFGTCAQHCPLQAIHVVNGVAVVDERYCVGCGLCVRLCPQQIIELKPRDSHIVVQCSNKDRGAMVKAVCAAGCIGCMLCARQCETQAITVVDNLARIDYDKCTQCGKCMEKCPVKAITKTGLCLIEED